MSATYAEPALLTNRAAVLLVGGAEADRRRWAEDAAAAFAHPLHDASDPAAFPAAAARADAVVYVADVTRLGVDVQRELARVLHQQEERPKLVLGLPGSVDGALGKGGLREDLYFAVRKGVVDLASAEVKDAMKKRAAKGKKR